MHIKKSDSRAIEHSPKCSVREFDLGSENMSVATASINGRYPEEGHACNMECEQIYYVLSGKASLPTSKGDFEIQQGDTYFFEKNEDYWFEAKDFEVVITNTPAWNKEQCENRE